MAEQVTIVSRQPATRTEAGKEPEAVVEVIFHTTVAPPRMITLPHTLYKAPEAGDDNNGGRYLVIPKDDTARREEERHIVRTLQQVTPTKPDTFDLPDQPPGA